jgi:hypothetical protein
VTDFDEQLRLQHLADLNLQLIRMNSALIAAEAENERCNEALNALNESTSEMRGHFRAALAQRDAAEARVAQLEGAGRRLVEELAPTRAMTPDVRRLWDEFAAALTQEEPDGR